MLPLDPSSVPGGLLSSRDGRGDILPRTTSADRPRSHGIDGLASTTESSTDEDCTGASFGFRGAPRASQLRVQAVTSRYAENRPRQSRQGSESRDDGDGFEPSPVRRMREHYQREIHDEENSRPPTVYRDDRGGSGFREDVDPPPWVQKMEPVQAHVKLAAEDAPYDDAVSLSSTPPMKGDGGKGALRMSAAGVLDAKRMKSSSLAFRWLSGLGIVPPGESPQ